MQALASNPLQAAAVGNVAVVSVAERSDTQIMSMHKALGVKSRVRGDFHARFCERVRVKLPRSTRPMTLRHQLLEGHGDWSGEIGDTVFDPNLYNIFPASST